MTYKKLIIGALLFLFSFTSDSFSIIKHHEPCKAAAGYENNWVLEFIDGSWWRVLYDSDGTIILKIPCDF